MKIQIARDRLLEPVRDMAQIATRKGVMPILNNYLLRVDPAGYITIETTDLEICAWRRIPAKISLPAALTRVLISADVLRDVLPKLAQGDITIDLPEGPDGNITIAQGTFRMELPASDPVDFPEMLGEQRDDKAVPIETEITGGSLLAVMERVNYAVSRDETRYVLTGVNLFNDATGVTACATDGFRLAVSENAGTEGKGIVIPKRTLVLLASLIEDTDNVTLTWTPRWIRFEVESRYTVVSKLIQGMYPEWRNIITRCDRTVTVERKELLRAIRIVEAVQVEHEYLVVLVGPETIALKIESQVGRAVTDIPIIRQTGEAQEKTIRVNGKYLSEAVGHVTGDEVTIEIPDGYGMITIAEGRDIHTFMPIRN